jgi:cyanophycin synthetase
MEFRRTMFLRGPNIWSRRPVIEVWVDLAELREFSSELIPGFNQRYKAWLPSVVEHRCSEGVRGGFFHRLDRGTYLAHILEHTALELQTLAGSDVGFGRAREMSEEGVYKVAVRYHEETLGKEALLAARELLKACTFDLPFDVAGTVARLHDMADRRCLGPSTQAIVDAATARNIPHRRLNTGSLVVLGHACKQRRIWTAETDRTGAIAESIAQDKELTKRLLRYVGVPVPNGRVVNDADDAVAAAEDLENAVVVKPQDANHGRGIAFNLTNPQEIRQAYVVAAQEGSGVIVEDFVPGFDHRLLVVGNRMVAATRGEPITVEADGKRTVHQLIVEVVNADPRRGEDETLPLSPVEIDGSLRIILEQQALTLDSVPAAGKRIMVKRHDNLSNDVTDLVHPSVAEHAVLAAKTVGLDVAGIDLLALDITCPLEEQGGMIVEVNAGPGLIMHLKPLTGKPRPVGGAIIEHMFGAEGDARIPIVCVTGSGGKSLTVRLIRTLLACQDHKIGACDRWGMYLDERCLDRREASDASRARDLLMHPNATAAVVRADADSILREGLGFDQCSIAVVTGVHTQDHLGGEFDLCSPERVFGVFRSPVDVVMPEGAAVLNAADPHCLNMYTLSKGECILFADEEVPQMTTESVGPKAEITSAMTAAQAMLTHLQNGGKCVGFHKGAICLMHGHVETPIAPLAALPMVQSDRLNGYVPSLLAAIAVAWKLGVPHALIAKTLASLSRSSLAAYLERSTDHLGQSKSA